MSNFFISLNAADANIFTRTHRNATKTEYDKWEVKKLFCVLRFRLVRLFIVSFSLPEQRTWELDIFFCSSAIVPNRFSVRLLHTKSCTNQIETISNRFRATVCSIASYAFYLCMSTADVYFVAHCPTSAVHRCLLLLWRKFRFFREFNFFECDEGEQEKKR